MLMIENHCMMLCIKDYLQGIQHKTGEIYSNWSGGLDKKAQKYTYCKHDCGAV